MLWPFGHETGPRGGGPLVGGDPEPGRPEADGIRDPDAIGASGLSLHRTGGIHRRVSRGPAVRPTDQGASRPDDLLPCLFFHNFKSGRITRRPGVMG